MKEKNILVIKPNIWFGFLGLEDENTIINFSNIIYDDNEVIQKKYDENSKKFNIPVVILAGGKGSRIFRIY